MQMALIFIHVFLNCSKCDPKAYLLLNDHNVDTRVSPGRVGVVRVGSVESQRHFFPDNNIFMLYDQRTSICMYLLYNYCL